MPDLICFIKYLLSGLLLVCGVFSCSENPDYLTNSLFLNTTADEISEIYSHVSISDYSGKKINAEIKLRGDPFPGGALGMPKKSFTIKTEQSWSPGEDIPISSNWILNASYMDKTLLRHKLSFDLFQELNPNLNKAPSSMFYDVFINDSFQGTYIIMQRPDEHMFELNLSDTASCLFKEPGIFFHPDSSFPTRKGPKNRYWQKYPAVKKYDHNLKMYNLSSFIHTSPDSVFVDSVKGIESLFSLKNLIDWHLYLVFSNNSTGFVKNFFLYKRNGKSPYLIGLWDCDRGFGRDDDNELNLNTFSGHEQNLLLKRLVHTNAGNYRNRLIEKWTELKTENIISSKGMKERILKLKAEVTPYIKNNTFKWPHNSPDYMDNNDFNQEVEIMLHFVDQRMDKVEQYLESLQKMN